MRGVPSFERELAVVFQSLALFPHMTVAENIAFSLRMRRRGRADIAGAVREVLDLPEANAMRAPGEAPGLATLEIAMDEMAEKLGMDPIEFRVLNDTQVVPDSPPKPPAKKPGPNPPPRRTAGCRPARWW